MTQPSPPREPTGADTTFGRIERVIERFVGEPLLWPVLTVVLAHAVVFAATLLLLAVRDRRPAALLAIALLAMLTAETARLDWRQRRRPGPASWLALAIWLLSGGLALIAHRAGVF